MLVVPIEKDVITTSDNLVYQVVEYTNFKDGGPAIYTKSKNDSSLTLVYFFDIVKINRTEVEYQKDSKVFNALGKIDRSQHLPQPDDKVTVGDKTVEVKSLKLKSKRTGESKGMLLKSTDDDYFRIKNIDDIQRALGGSNFNKDKFLELYRDYIGI